MYLMHTREKLTVCDLAHPDQFFSMDRSEFYAEQSALKKPTKAVAIVDIFLFDAEGEIFVQKRSNTKTHNPGLFDKSVGGHMQFGDDSNYTSMVETVQELQVPSIALYTEEDFQKTLILLKSYLNTVAVLKHVSTFIDTFEKVIEGKVRQIANQKFLFFGVYNGSVKTVDRESKGILLYSLEDLQEEMKQFPERFTYDLQYYVRNFSREMHDFSRLIASIK